MDDYARTNNQNEPSTAQHVHTNAEEEIYAWIVAHLRQASPDVLQSVFYFIRPFFQGLASPAQINHFQIWILLERTGHLPGPFCFSTQILLGVPF